MKQWLLDTNVLSEARKGQRCDCRVASWLRKHAGDPQYTSVICLMEIRLGIELLKRRQPEGGQRLEEWYEKQLKPAFGKRLLSIDGVIAEGCARLHAMRPRSFRDALIGATAGHHGMVLVTRNEKDFVDMAVTVVNPWRSE